MNEKTIDVPKELILRLKEENEKMLERVTKLEKKLKGKQY
jgi:BMFP domain-containing protein YqiC